MRFALATILTVFGGFGIMGIAGCSKTHSKPNTIYMEEMVYSKSFKAQEEGGMLVPVKGTVPRDHYIYPYRMDPDGAGKNLVNPFAAAANPAVVAQGAVLYGTYCSVCHGPTAEGDGSIVPKFPRPPSLHNDKVKGWSDGRIFHVMTVGQGLMASYAGQVRVEDRWRIVQYIRKMQADKKPAK